jgi:hypothetical protein
MDSIGILKSLWKVAILSIAVLIASIFINLSSAQIGPLSINSFWAAILQYGIPISLGILFTFSAKWAIEALETELKGDGLTEAEITRVIEKYTGFVDGLGTAMPLIGAAILLYTIGYEFENDSQRKLAFSGFAVPFEIKAILILASAKLFESVFDEIALRYQVKCRENVSSPNDLTRESVQSITRLLEGVDSAKVSSLTELVIELKKESNTSVGIDKLKQLSDSMSKPLDAMRDSNVRESLDCIKEIAGILKNSQTK